MEVDGLEQCVVEEMNEMQLVSLSPYQYSGWFSYLTIHTGYE